MWGSGFILTRINCAFSQMHTHNHHHHPHCSKNVDSSGSEQTEMIRDEDNDLLTETGGGGGGVVEVHAGDCWSCDRAGMGWCIHACECEWGGVGESFYFGETTAVAFSHAGIPVSKLYAWASTVNHTFLKCMSYLHVCQVSPTWYSSECLQVEDVGKAVDIKHEAGQHSKCIFIQVFISKSCSQNLLSWAFVDQACVQLFSKQNSAGRRMNSISCYITLCCPAAFS